MADNEVFEDKGLSFQTVSLGLHWRTAAVGHVDCFSSSDAHVISIVKNIITFCFLWDFKSNSCHFGPVKIINMCLSTAHFHTVVGNSDGNNQFRKELLDLFFTFLLRFFFWAEKPSIILMRCFALLWLTREPVPKSRK